MNNDLDTGGDGENFNKFDFGESQETGCYGPGVTRSEPARG